MGTPPPPAATGTFDRRFFDAQYGPDPELLAKIMSAFLETCPGIQQELRDSSQFRDAERLERVAHTLRGALSYLTDQGSFVTVSQMHTALRQGESERAFALVPQLESELKNFCGDLNRALASLR